MAACAPPFARVTSCLGKVPRVCVRTRDGFSWLNRRRGLWPKRAAGGEGRDNVKRKRVCDSSVPV